MVFLSFDDALTGSADFDNVRAVSPDKNVEIQELQREVFRAVLEMPENYRAMIVLRYQLDLTNSEIAETLGITRENVEVRMHRAHKTCAAFCSVEWLKGGLNMKCKQVDDLLFAYCDLRIFRRRCSRNWKSICRSAGMQEKG